MQQVPSDLGGPAATGIQGAARCLQCCALRESRLTSSYDSRPPHADITIEAAARSFHREAVGYGFSLCDFVSFASTLLGLAIATQRGGAERTDGPQPPADRHARLPVVGLNTTIRAFGDPGDRECLERWVADDEGRLFLLSTASGRRQDVEHLVQSPANRIGMVTVAGRPIGCVAYLDHRADQGRAELRKMIGEREMRGRGFAREAATQWLGYGLGALGLKKVYLTTLVTDIRNIKINENLGFRVEGILRKEVLVDGDYHDVLRMGLCAA
jgi:RimJ/RimL family protein N-acetyltransferase